MLSWYPPSNRSCNQSGGEHSAPDCCNGVYHEHILLLTGAMVIVDSTTRKTETENSYISTYSVIRLSGECSRKIALFLNVFSHATKAGRQMHIWDAHCFSYVYNACKSVPGNVFPKM